MMTLSFTSHHQLGGTLQDRVRRALAADLESGKYRPGDQLPTERELAASLGVSLAPVRVALDQLAQTGAVVRRQGKGTFVSQRRVPYRLETWSSCTDDLKRQKIDFSVTVLECSNSQPSPEVAQRLQIPPSEHAFRLVRMVRVSDEPGIFLESWVRDFDGSPYLDGTLFSEGHSLYRQLRNHGIHLRSAEMSISISFAGEFEAGLFEASYGAPQLEVTGVAFDDTGPREWSRLRYNAAIFSLNMRRFIEASE
jgi:GntR family transcriptional regulator